MAAPKGNQYAKGHGKGRPLIYDDDRLEEEAIALLEWVKVPDNLFLEDFAWDRGYSPKRISEFAKSNKDFSESLEQFKDRQVNKLLKLGLNRGYDPGFTRYTLPRVAKDRPEWRASWDQPEETKEAPPANIIINKIEK